jgi:galactokinase/mevalonate kinase-like predicted kinase
VQNRIFLAGFCPEWEGYDALAQADKAQITRVAKLIDTPALAGFGKSSDEVKAAQLASVAALKAAVANPTYFKETLATLAKTLQKSAHTELA